MIYYMLISGYTAKDWQTAYTIAYEELYKQIEDEGYFAIPESLEVTRDSYMGHYGWLCSMKYNEQDV